MNCLDNGVCMVGMKNGQYFLYSSILAFIVGVVYFYSPTLLSLHEHWTQVSSNYSHGYLLLVVSFYLLCEDRAKLLTCNDFKFSYWFLIPLLVCSLVWMLATLIQVQLVQQLTLLPIVYFFICSIFGLKGAKIAVFPVGLIFLAIPVWHYLIEVLQYLTVVACTFGLSILEIPVNIERFYINLPVGSLYVAGSCSGLSYFLTAVSLGAVQAQLNYNRVSRKVLLVIIAAIFGLVSNWVRVFSLIVIAHETEMKSSLMQDHFWHGWFIFALSLVPLYWVSRKLQDKAPDISEKNTSTVSAKGVKTLVLFLALLFAFTGPILVKILGATNKLASIGQLPAFLVDYKLVKGVPYDWTPNYSNADAITSGKLSRGRDVINFYAYTYFSQSQGKELIYYSNTISNEEWRGGDVETYHSKKFKVFKTRLTSSISKRVKLVYYWYQIGGKVASSDFDAKLFQLAGQLNGRQDVALLAVSTDCNVGCADAEKMLNKLIEPVNDMYLSLIKYE